MRTQNNLAIKRCIKGPLNQLKTETNKVEKKRDLTNRQPMYKITTYVKFQFGQNFSMLKHFNKF